MFTGRECSVWRPVFLSEFHRPPHASPHAPPHFPSLILSLSDGEGEAQGAPENEPMEAPKSTTCNPVSDTHLLILNYHRCDEFTGCTLLTKY